MAAPGNRLRRHLARKIERKKSPKTTRALEELMAALLDPHFNFPTAAGKYLGEREKSEFKQKLRTLVHPETKKFTTLKRKLRDQPLPNKIGRKLAMNAFVVGPFVRGVLLCEK